MSRPQTAAAYPPPPDLAHDVTAWHARYTAANGHDNDREPEKAQTGAQAIPTDVAHASSRSTTPNTKAATPTSRRHQP